MGRGDEYNCFGCSPHNPLGLKLEFWDHGEGLTAKWNPDKNMEGWNGIIHGGIQATLLDELAGWVVLVKMKTAGVTVSLHADYLKPALIAHGTITLTGEVKSTGNRSAVITCNLTDGAGTLCTKAEIACFCFPEHIARAKYHYPGIEAFFEGE